jgi:plasmid stabilization system protein ParE
MKTYRVDVSEAAELEADQIYLWIQQRSPDAAHRWYTGLLQAFDTLTRFPHRCAALPGRPDIRRLLYGNYWIISRIVEVAESTAAAAGAPAEEPSVRILHIHHAARDAPRSASDEEQS